MLYEALLWIQPVWNVPLGLCLICIGILYTYLLKRFTTIKLYDKKPLLFFLSFVLLFLITGSPLSTVSHLSFSLHMIQMSILYFIIPPLILIGIHESLFKRIFKISVIKRMRKLFLQPKSSLILFAFLFLMYHLPSVLKIISQNSFIQNGFLLFLFILSFSMWWPIVSPDQKQRFLKKQKKRYAFLSGVVLMPACILFIFNAVVVGMDNPFLNQISSLCTPTQSDSLSFLPPPFNTRFDQIMAGVLMLGMHKFGITLSLRLGNSGFDKTATFEKF